MVLAFMLAQLMPWVRDRLVTVTMTVMVTAW